MKNGSFAPTEIMLNFPYLFQIHDISKASTCVIMEKGVNIYRDYPLPSLRCTFIEQLSSFADEETCNCFHLLMKRFAAFFI